MHFLKFSNCAVIVQITAHTKKSGFPDDTKHIYSMSVMKNSLPL